MSVPCRRRTVGAVVSNVLRLVPERVRGLRLSEYDALVAAGLLEGERVELLEGELVEVAPTSPEHAWTTERVADALRDQRPTGWRVRTQQPLAVPPSSEPEPDVAVVRDQDYSHAHPRTALLVVEVARSSRETDLQVKPALYATAGVQEYWVVDPDERVVHVHRRRQQDGYGEVSVHRSGVLRSDTEPPFTLDLDAVLPT